MGRLTIAAAVTAVAAFIAIPTPTSTTQPAVAAPVNVADRYRAADQIDRSTRDPLAVPSPFTTPTNEPEPEPVAEPAVNQPAPTGGTLPALLLTIRANESGGNYQAFNPTGCEGYGCGGAYQLHAGYASGWAAEAGYPGLPGNAAQWPPTTQDAVALYKFYATNPDGALWCSWCDYC